MTDRKINPIDERRALAALARTHFIAYVRIMFEVLHPGQKLELAPYLNLIAADLEGVRRGETNELMINLAPRSLKSFVATICFATWMLGLDSRRQIMIASHNMEMAKRHLVGVRKILESDKYAWLFPNFQIGDKNAEAEVTTSLGGYVLAVSFDSAPTGRGADLIIIDDPLGAHDIYSKVARDGCENYYQDALVSRRNRLNSPVVLVMQRLCEDDLAGRLIATGGWKVRSLPAIATKDEAIPYRDLEGDHVFRRKAGEVLNPSRMTIEELEKRKASPRNWAAQYQQSPVGSGDRLVKSDWLKKYTALPTGKGFHVQSWDTASSKSDRACFSVALTWWVQKDGVYLVDIFRAKRDYDEIREDAIRLARAYKPLHVLIEDNSSGPVINHAVKDLGIDTKIHLIKPSEAKEQRLEKCLGMFTGSKVYLPEVGVAVQGLIDELLSFPYGSYDDQVDAATLFLNWVEPRRDGSVKERGFDFAEKILARGPPERDPPGFANVGRGLQPWGSNGNLRPGSGGNGPRRPRRGR